MIRALYSRQSSAPKFPPCPYSAPLVPPRPAHPCSSPTGHTARVPHAESLASHSQKPPPLAACKLGQRWKALSEAEKTKYKGDLAPVPTRGRGGLRAWAPASPVSVLPPPAATITTSTAGPLGKIGWVPSSPLLPLTPVPPPVPPNVPPPARDEQPTGAPISTLAPAPPAPAFAPPPPLPAHLSQMLLDELTGLASEGPESYPEPTPLRRPAGWSRSS